MAATTLVSNREGSISKQGVSFGEVWTRARITVTGEQVSDGKYKVTVTGQTRSGNVMGVQKGNHCLANWGVTGYAGINGVGSTTSSRQQYNYTSWVCTTTYSATISQSNTAKQITCYANYSAADGVKCGVSVNVSIPARKLNDFSEPTFTASATTVHFGESVVLSWGKASTQGNANFDRFELWQGSNKLYSGSAISMSVKPSDVCGASGGEVVYTLKEIHEWYGTYPSKSVDITITVQSGVVTAYDSSGKKHTSIVTAYDDKGKAHFVLITAYDSSGKGHAVI